MAGRGVALGREARITLALWILLDGVGPVAERLGLSVHQVQNLAVGRRGAFPTQAARIEEGIRTFERRARIRLQVQADAYRQHIFAADL